MGKTTVTSTTAIGICSSNIGIPPYQRKGGKWKEEKSKKKVLFLSSVANNFPIGSFVIHAELNSTEEFLMDGQQRRETLDEMLRIRPILDILCIKFGQDIVDFEDKFLLFLTEFFYKADELGTFDPMTPGVKKIVQLRKKYGKRTTMKGHKIYPFEKIFTHKRILGNPYINSDGSIKSEDLIKKLIDCDKDSSINALPLDTEDEKKEYAAAILEKLGISAFLPFKLTGKMTPAQSTLKSKNSVINRLSISSVEIKEVCSLLNQFHMMVSGCHLGKITFTADVNEDSTEYELPTIFRLINDGGEKMHIIELLASAPRWIGSNSQFSIDPSTADFISDIISSLKKDTTTPTNKWLVCASYARAIDELNKDTGNQYKMPSLLFSPLSDFGPKEYEIGFRMRSLFKFHSVTDKDWQRLYEIEKTDYFWTHLNELSELSTIFQLLGEDPYFKQMRRWGWSITDQILRNRTRSSRDTVGMLAALRILFLRNPGITTGSNWTLKKKFILPARKWFDYFVYHNIGSMVFSAPGADGKMKTHLDKLRDDNTWVPSVSKADWKELIEALLNDGKDRLGEDYTHSDKSPKDKSADWADWTRLLLAHIYTINHLWCPDDTVKYHVDHIIPRDLWETYYSSDPDNTHHCHNFANLMFLDATANENKNNKTLEEVWSDLHTRNFITKYGGIEGSKDKFRDFSQPISEDTHMKIVNERKTLLKDSFIDNRQAFLMNEEWW